MTHHLLPEIDRDWLGAVTNCFLIRDPREVINSYIKKREDPALEDLGFVQQAEIFDFGPNTDECRSARCRCQGRAAKSGGDATTALRGGRGRF